MRHHLAMDVPSFHFRKPSPHSALSEYVFLFSPFLCSMTIAVAVVLNLTMNNSGHAHWQLPFQHKHWLLMPRLMQKRTSLPDFCAVLANWLWPQFSPSAMVKSFQHLMIVPINVLLWSKRPLATITVN